MKKIDFFIIGAPKCGTDSLRKYLNQSNDVFMCGPQEPNYFCSDIQPLNYSIDTHIDKYFLKAPKNKFWGEKSTWYLASQKASFACVEHNSKALYIAVVREQMSMFISLHAELRKLGVEPIADPEDAWHHSFKRDLSSLKGNKRFLHYPSACALGEQVQHWQSVVGAENLLVVNLDDIKTDSDELIKICKFLKVRPPNIENLPHENSAASGELTNLGRILNPGKQTLLAVDKLKKLLGVNSLGIGGVLAGARRKFGMKEYKRAEMSAEAKAEVTKYFEDDSLILENCLNNNFTRTAAYDDAK